MSAFNPYAVEEVPFENSAVSVFAGQGRYSGGVSGLGGERSPDEVEPKYTASFRHPDGREVKSSFDVWKPGTWEIVRTDTDGVKTASLPGWAVPVIGLGVLGVGGYFIWKAIKRR